MFSNCGSKSIMNSSLRKSNSQHDFESLMTVGSVSIFCLRDRLLWFGPIFRFSNLLPLGTREFGQYFGFQFSCLSEPVNKGDLAKTLEKSPRTAAGFSSIGPQLQMAICFFTWYLRTRPTAKVASRDSNVPPVLNTRTVRQIRCTWDRLFTLMVSGNCNLTSERHPASDR